MKRSLALCLLMASAVLAQPHDVAGWSKTKWGMTAAQLKDLFPSAKPQENGLELVDFDVAGVPCRVVMVIGKSGRLERVGLVSSKGTHRNAEKLLDGLTEKYGPPISGKDAHRSWSFTSTTITFWALFSPSKDDGMIFLTYEPPGSAQPNL